MRFLSFFAALFFALLSGCVSSAPDLKAPPSELPWEPQAPFRGEKKVEIPAEARALGHFAKGQSLLSQGEFGQALTEFEGAVQADPSNSFLRFRLATLYLRKGDLKNALRETEEATRLEPGGVDNHLLLAGLCSSLGEEAKSVREYQEVLRLDQKNQEALLYLGALYLKLGDYERATKSLEQLLAVRSEE